MIGRFSLYGFLKNQQYYEPFFLLALLAKGLSFFEYGLLIGFREIVINIMEIPSGALADVYGRRRCMVISFCAYIVSFLVFGFGVSLWQLFLAMFFFAIGEAFRTGTHKAMIFSWLRSQGRTDERIKVYGYTRSWSKTGSAVSAVVAAVFVLLTEDYVLVFFLTIPPYFLALVNFLGYPEELDGKTAQIFSIRRVFSHLVQAMKLCWRRASLRRLILESMGFTGFFRSFKDYLQPVLKTSAVSALGFGVFAGFGDVQKSAVLVGAVYGLLYLLSAVASRKAESVSERCGGEERTSALLWLVYLMIFVLMTPAMVFSWHGAMIVGFVVLFIVQNLWQPVLLARFDAQSSEAQGATILSIESQARSLATMIVAPLLGLMVDHADRLLGWVATRLLGRGAEALPDFGDFWPIGLVGVIVALAAGLASVGDRLRPRKHELVSP
jgi:MFS family permease